MTDPPCCIRPVCRRPRKNLFLNFRTSLGFRGRSLAPSMSRRSVLNPFQYGEVKRHAVVNGGVSRINCGLDPVSSRNFSRSADTSQGPRIDAHIARRTCLISFAHVHTGRGGTAKIEVTFRLRLMPFLRRIFSGRAWSLYCYHF